MNELSELQQQIIDNPYRAIFVESCAAVGKTALIVEKIKLEVAANKGKVVAFTFTNAAAEEMYERIGQYDPDKLFIGTIHSYCLRLLLSCGVDEAFQYCEENQFDGLFSLVEDHPECVQPIYCLICDEMQDCNTNQFEFIFNMNHPKKYFCCYDKRQSIYRWNDAHPEYIDDYAVQVGADIVYLNENYRNTPEILDFAKNIIAPAGYEYRDNSIPMREHGAPVKTKISYSPRAIAATFAEMEGGFGDWFVLARTNAQVDEICYALSQAEVPYVSFKRADLNNQQLREKMNEDSVKVLTIHSCLSGNTLIQTSNGIKTIKEIVERSDYSELIYDGEKYARVKTFIDNGKEKVYKITTNYGNTIEVTKNHEVCILTENGIEKRKTFELKGNEELLLCKDIPDTTHKVPLEKIDHTKLDVRTVIYQEPDYLTEGLAELIGLITADGSYNTSSIHYIKHYKECCDRFAELVYEIFGKRLKVIRNPRGDDSYVCECNSKFILNFLKLNFDGITPCNKFISSKILEGNKSIYRAFLRGLFEDGTIHMKKQRFDHICLTFKNDRMKEQLQTMLFNLGIDCVFKKYECQKNINNLQIYAGGAEKFKKIGFISSIKQKKLEKCQQKYKKKNKSRSLCQLILHYKNKLRFKNSQLSNLLRDGTITEYSMEQLVLNNEKAFEKDPKLHLAGQIFSKYQVEQIVDIAFSEEEVDTYCLEMEDKHEFIQNGFLMGNSKGLERNNVIVVGAKFYNLEERCISYVAATRARDRLYWTSMPTAFERATRTSNWEN